MKVALVLVVALTTCGVIAVGCGSGGSGGSGGAGGTAGSGGAGGAGGAGGSGGAGGAGGAGGSGGSGGEGGVGGTGGTSETPLLGTLVLSSSGLYDLSLFPSYDGTGTFLSVANKTGGGDSARGDSEQLLTPNDMAFDPGDQPWPIGGRIFIADRGNGRILQITGNPFTADHTVKEFKRDPISGATISGPLAVAVGPDHKIFIVDTGNDRIVRIDDITGKNWAMFGTHGNGDYELTNPGGIALGAPRGDNTYLIYIADTGNSRVAKINNISGDKWLVAAMPDTTFSAPHGVFISDDQSIYVADTGNSRIIKLDDPSGGTYTAFGTKGKDPGQLNGPNDVFVDSTGITIADWGNRRVVHIDDMTGANFKTMSGKFAGPIAVAVTR